MRLALAIFLGVISSAITGFYLFAIAFNTPYVSLRQGFLPIYIAIVVTVIVCALIAPRWRAMVTAMALLAPMIVLAWIAQDNTAFWLDVGAIMGISFLLAFAAGIVQTTFNGAEHVVGGNGG